MPEQELDNEWEQEEVAEGERESDAVSVGGWVGGEGVSVGEGEKVSVGGEGEWVALGDRVAEENVGVGGLRVKVKEKDREGGVGVGKETVPELGVGV